MSIVDPAEALMAVIGVRPIISHVIEQVTPRDFQRAGVLGDECDAIALQMSRGKLDALTVNDFERIDYSATLRDLSTPYMPAQVDAMLSSIPLGLEGLHAGFIEQARKAFEYLYSQFPITLRKAVGADNNTAPPRRLVSRFESLLWLMDNPLGVFNLMGNATLTAQQLAGMKTLYPTLSAHIGDDSIPAAIETMRVGQPRFQLPRMAEAGVKRFLGRLSVAPDLAAVLQDKPKGGPEQDGKQAAPSRGVLSTKTAPASERAEQQGA